MIDLHSAGRDLKPSSTEPLFQIVLRMSRMSVAASGLSVLQTLVVLAEVCAVVPSPGEKSASRDSGELCGFDDLQGRGHPRTVHIFALQQYGFSAPLSPVNAASS